MGYIEDMRKSYATAFEDSHIESNLAYRPKLVSNDRASGQKVLTAIERELSSCTSFSISVAFINMSGIEPLLQVLKDLEEKNVCGRIMTTDYLAFSEPKALRKLAQFPNITLRMFRSYENRAGFHTKGYIFDHTIDGGEVFHIITGSSNLTSSALTLNKEWNTRIVSLPQGEYAQSVMAEYDYMWELADPIGDYIETYERLYLEKKKVTQEAKVAPIAQYKLEPNDMQIRFVQEVGKLIDAGEKRGLLISATGTGKTYAAAFALRDRDAKKVLFIVHREQIARQAKESFETIFGSSRTTGLLSGNAKDTDKDFLFATMQMMAKDDVRKTFLPNAFDYIVVDEAHRAAADSYHKIMDYFKPKFWLGMTASPDRPDAGEIGRDIYKLFDNNIAYEIRLKQALEEDMLCPFQYFGITDIEIDGKTFDDQDIKSHVAMLASDVRVDYVMEKANYYGYSGDRVKGLMFCSGKKEAAELSEKFNARGLRTIALTGDTSQEDREKAVERLSADEGEDALDYIITVDIFNEGVDIPEINQVIMLRPTESPIIFIQQLGRGLRKSAGKEFVVVIDFIGNYNNNFMIPIALSGDRTYNRDNIRRYLQEGDKLIPGSSSIHFDEISKKKIYDSIDKMKTTKKLLSEKYFNLKNKLGRIPSLCDFYDYSEIDPLLILDYAGTYEKLKTLIEKDYKCPYNDVQMRYLEFVSKYLADGKRANELIYMKLLLDNKEFSEAQWTAMSVTECGALVDDSTISSAKSYMCGNFINTQSERIKYKGISFASEIDDKFKISEDFNDCIADDSFKLCISDVVNLGLKIYMEDYLYHADGTGLTLYKKYSRKDVCRILNWPKDESATIYGYTVKHGVCPIFVTYKKKEDISSSTKYEDEFVDPKTFSWMTRSRVSEESRESQALIHARESGLRIYLFIKKSDGEGSDFYYLGETMVRGYKQTTITDDKGKELPIMNFILDMNHEVKEEIYNYLTN